MAVDWGGMDNGSTAAGGIGLLPKGFNLEHGCGQVTRCGAELDTALAVVVMRADPRKTSYVRNLNLVYRADDRRHSRHPNPVRDLRQGAALAVDRLQ